MAEKFCIWYYLCRSLRNAARTVNGHQQRIALHLVQCKSGRMFGTKTLFVAAVFMLAGMVNGIVGLGLPTIAMGLLAVVIFPLEAATILIAPALATNVWQMPVGRRLAQSHAGSGPC